MFSLFRRKSFLTKTEAHRIAEAIRLCEEKTSGEIRIFVEPKSKNIDPFDRAAVIFGRLNMHQTEQRNGVLLYIAHVDRKFAILGDIQIQEFLPSDFWQARKDELQDFFKGGNYCEGILHCIREVSAVLEAHFPANGKNKNELPDEIVFG